MSNYFENTKSSTEYHVMTSDSSTSGTIVTLGRDYKSLGPPRGRGGCKVGAVRVESHMVTHTHIVDYTLRRQLGRSPHRAPA